jgi:hypothetical protein
MKKKILFCATTPMNYAMFKPVHRRLKQDPRIEVWLTANHNTKKLYQSIGLEKELVIGKYHSMVRHWDMCICPSFYYERNNADVKVQIFHGCSLKNRAVHKKALQYDKLFLIGPYMRQKFISTWKLSEDDPRFENIGMPKLDAFFDGSLDKDAIVRQLNLDPGLPTVIYAPTRTSVTSSSLQMYGRQIISTVSEMPVNFLIKLHDRAYKQWKPGMKEDWMEILESYNDHPRVRPVYDYDITPYLYVSDLLISDISSVVNEFTLLNRPMVLIDVPRLISHHKTIELKRGVEVSDLEEWGRHGGHLIKDMQTLAHAVNNGLEHPEEKNEIRQEFARKFFFPPGEATEKAMGKIYELLGLSAPGGS